MFNVKLSSLRFLRIILFDSGYILFEINKSKFIKIVENCMDPKTTVQGIHYTTLESTYSLYYSLLLYIGVYRGVLWFPLYIKR